MAKTYSPCTSCKRLNRVEILDASETRQPVCGSCKTELPLKGCVNALDDEGLRVLLSASPQPVIVDFWAVWCGPCRVFAPIFESTARALSTEIVFAKVDTAKSPKMSAELGIRSIPTLVFFKSGHEIDRVSGALPLGPFQQWLRSKLYRAA